MPNHSDFQDKIDVLDLIISILKDHEETLSRLADRFDAIYDDISALGEKIPTLDHALERLDGLKVKSVVEGARLKGTLAAVKCKDWLTFQAASQGALLVAFEVTDDRCMFYSVSDLFVFTYSEDVLGVRILVDKGVKKWLRRRSKSQALKTLSLEEFSSEDGESVYKILVNPRIVRQWLCLELGVPDERIVEGRVLG